MADENPYAAPEADIAVDVDPQDAELAGRWARLGGSLIDGFLILAIVFPVAYLIGYFQEAAAQETTLAENLMLSFLGVVVFVILNGYLLAKNGQSIGKLIVGTRIVSVHDGRILPFGKVIGLRYLPFWIVSNVPFVGQLITALIDPLLIFRDDKRCLHDLVAGTKVFKA